MFCKQRGTFSSFNTLTEGLNQPIIENHHEILNSNVPRSSNEYLGPFLSTEASDPGGKWRQGDFRWREKWLLVLSLSARVPLAAAIWKSEWNCSAVK
jgi:hypothetical protein